MKIIAQGPVGESAEIRRGMMSSITTCTEVLDAGQMSLPDLANSINVSTQQAETRARSAVQYALEAGQLLIEAKRRVPHGEWAAWLADNCTVAPRTAQSYMRLARRIPELPNAQRVADLPLREAMTAIATSPEAPPKRAQVRAPARREERERVVRQFRGTANVIRDAARSLAAGLDVRNTAVLRNKLSAAIDLLDRLQRQGGQDEF